MSFRLDYIQQEVQFQNDWKCDSMLHTASSLKKKKYTSTGNDKLGYIVTLT